VKVLLVVGIIVVVLLWVAGLLLARGVRRLRRFGGAALDQVTEVRARFLPPGPRREAALLRRRLQAELRATRSTLAAAPDGLVFRADAAALLAELATAAADLDRDLAAVERFLDAGQQRSALGTLRPQAEQVIATTYTARQTVLRTAVEDRTRHLDRLQADVARQADALDRYRAADRDRPI
jgi:hypothetical protein